MTLKQQIRRRPELHQQLRRVLRPAWFGTLRRTTPLSDHWGYDRGHPIDRHYIERFLALHREDIHGRVLEIKEALYAARFGDAISSIDILDVDPANGQATIVADLTRAVGVPSAAFDCCIVTQTLQYIYDASAAVGELHRILRDDGVALVTVPAITRLDRRLRGPDYWRFTVDSCARLFGEVFGSGAVSVVSYGNVLAATAFLQGVAQEELAASELDLNDPLVPLIVAVRAVKQGTT